MIPSPHPVISMFITRLRRSQRLIVIVTIMLNLVPFFNGHALAAQSSATITLSRSTSQTITIPPAKSGIPLVHASQTAKAGLHPNSPAIPNYSGYLPNLNIGATLSNPMVHTVFFGFDKNSSSDNQRIDGIVNFLQGISGTGIAGVLNQYVGSDQMSYDSKKLFDISPIPTSGTCGGVPNYSQDDISNHIFSLSVGLHWNPTNSVVLFYLGSQANYGNCGCGVHSSVIVPTGVQAFAILPPVDIYNTTSNSYPCLSDATLSRYYTNRYNLNELGTWPWYAYGSVTLHELFEAITDPYWNYGLFAWIDGNGQEIGDVCPEPGGRQYPGGRFM